MDLFLSFSSVIISSALIGVVNSVAGSFSNVVYSQSAAYFHSQSQNFRIKIGEDVTFPCHVNNRGSDVITWKNGVRLLTAGPIKVYNEERLVHRANGTELTLKNVQPVDKGEYACQLNTMGDPIELVHHLDVLMPPRVVARQEGEVQARAGEKAELECVAHGNPQPQIEWRRKDGRKIKGQTVGSRLTLDPVDRSMSGEYECMASNGVEEPGEEATAIVGLQVLYPPEITVARSKLQFHPKLGAKALTISCNVSADPSPDVNWLRRQGEVLSQQHKKGKNPWVKMHSWGGSKSSRRRWSLAAYWMKSNSSVEVGTRTFQLTIRNVREEDFGNYTCHATNPLGQARQEIVVSGKPLPPVFLSGEPGDKTEYTLRWRVDSAFPVEEHNVYYERIVDGEEYFKPVHSCQTGRERWCGHCRPQQPCVLNIREEGTSSWASLVKKTAEARLSELVPNSSYRVKIQTVNTYGRSLWSQPFEFDTYGVQTQKPSPFFFASRAPSTILPLPLHLLLLPQVLLLPLLQDRLPQTPAFL